MQLDPMKPNKYFKKTVHQTVHSSIIPTEKKRKQPKCLTANEWMNEMCSLQIWACNLAIKRKYLSMLQYG